MSRRKHAIRRDAGRHLTDQQREILGRAFKARVYDTRAYASYEKGAVENCNRIIRRWFPKGTDFSKVPREDVLAVEAIVNTIHRRSLKGETAYACDSRLAQTH